VLFKSSFVHLDLSLLLEFTPETGDPTEFSAMNAGVCVFSFSSNQIELIGVGTMAFLAKQHYHFLSIVVVAWQSEG